MLAVVIFYIISFAIRVKQTSLTYLKFIIYTLDVIVIIVISYLYTKNRYLLPGKLTESHPFADKYPEKTGHQFLTVFIWSLYILSISLSTFKE